MSTVIRVDGISRVRLMHARIRRCADLMLADLGLKEAELSVLLTGDEGIRMLNRAYRHQNKPTDVLSFPMDDTPLGTAAQRGSTDVPQLLGDVVISIETADRQARQTDCGLWNRIIELLAHGLLHLVGYDHHNRADREAMEAMTARLVAIAGRRRRAEARDRVLPGKRAAVRTGNR